MNQRLHTRVAVVSQTEIGHYGLCGVIDGASDLECSGLEDFPIRALATRLERIDVVVVMMAPDALEEMVREIHVLYPDMPVVGVVDALTIQQEDIVRLLHTGLAGLTASLSSGTIVCMVRLAAQHAGVIDMSLVHTMTKP